MHWTKASEQVLRQLRLLCGRRVQNVTSSQSIGFSRDLTPSSSALSYCQTRFMYMTRVCSSQRYLHTARRHHKKHDNDIPQDQSSRNKMAPEENDPEEKKLVKRIAPPKPVLEERESSLPTHDVSRITPESRRLEFRASMIFDDIATMKGANKVTFLMAVNRYLEKETLYRRGAVEFIYAGLQEMKRFGVEKDLTAYKALIQAFPEGKMIPRNVWQVEFMHYPRQQQCGIDLLEQMEHNGIIPDDEFGRLLKNRFGYAAHVTRKYRRMMYWLPKFKNMNPYPMPFQLPDDAVELALLALKRMCVDRETKYHVYKTSEIEVAPEEDTFIASAQSPIQQQLISKHKSEQPLFVEGPYPVYLRHIGQQYFLLRAEPNINSLMKEKQMQAQEENDENLFEWTNFFEEEECKELKPILSVHEQEDSTILGLCITGTSTKYSVVSWIRCLEKSNPNLVNTPVLFKLITPDKEIEAIGDSRPFTEIQKT